MRECDISDLEGCKIARVSTAPFFVFSQLDSQLFDIACANGNVIVICSEGEELRKLTHHKNLRTHIIEISRKISLFKDIMALWCLYQFLRKEKIDICHSTTPKAGIISMVAATLAGTKVRIHTFTGQPWATNKTFKNQILRICDIIICKLASKTFADSITQREFLINEKITKEPKISVIGSGSLAGVNIARFEAAKQKYQPEDIRSALGISNTNFIIIFVGRITPEKGISELLAAYSELRKKYNDIDLILVGPFDRESGSGNKFDSLQVLDLPGIHYTGLTLTPEKYLTTADIICLPSYREGFGTVVMEAAVMEVPAVGTNIYGLKDAIVDQVTGLLVEPGNPNALYLGIEKLYLDGQLRKKFGQNAKQRCYEIFDSKMISRKLIDEYLLLMSEKGH